MSMAVLCKTNLKSLPELLARSLSVSTGTYQDQAYRDPALRPYSEIPGPRQLPIIGNGRELNANVHRFREYVHENFKYGEIYKLKSFGKRFVVIRDPTAIESVLRAEGKFPRRDIGVSEGMNWLMKNRVKRLPMMGMEFDERWKKLRSSMGKQIIPRNVYCFTPGFSKIYQRFAEYIRNTRDADNVMADIAYPIKLLFVEISAHFAFGNDINVLTDPSGEHKEFVEAVQLLFKVLGQLVVSPPLYKLYNNKLSRDYVKSFKVIYDVANKEMEKLYSRLEKGEESETPGLMEQWLRDGKMSEEEVISETTGIFFAGVDTTANQSAFLLHDMAKNPDVQEKLYQELKSVLGDSTCITSEHLPQLPYLKGCMLESFRLNSTVASVGRVLDEECYLFGHTIPPKTYVMYSIYSAGRDERLFPDPMNFDPDRWKRDETHAFAIRPFGFGPRSCYGRRFAELELKLLLSQIVLNFQLSTDMKELKCTQRATVAPDGSVPIKFTDRQNL